jgi:hypothetical protein
MVDLFQLWLPILLSSVAVFFLSFLMWMALPHHKSDWTGLPDEDAAMDLLRSQGVKRGQYAIPHCASKELMRDPEFIAKWTKGPKGFLIVQQEGPLSMGGNLAKSFTFNVVTATLVAYVATMGLEPGADGMLVFRFTTTVAFLANSLALGWGAIWFSRTWSSTLKEMFDGLLYAAATGALFMALWPGAV